MAQQLFSIVWLLSILFSKELHIVESSLSFTICGLYNKLNQPLDEQIIGMSRMGVEKVNSDYAGQFQFELLDIEFAFDSAFSKFYELNNCLLGNDPIAVIGPVTSADSLLLSPLAGSVQVPVISYGATSPIFSDKQTFPFFTRVIQDDSQQGEALVDLVSRFGWKNVGLIYQNDAYGLGLAEEFGNFAAIQGVEIVLSETFAVNESFTFAKTQNLINSGANIFVLIAFENEAISVLNEALKGDLLGGNNVWILSDAGAALLDRIDENPFNINEQELEDLKPNLTGIIGLRPAEGAGPEYDEMLSIWNVRNGSLFSYSRVFDKFTTGLESAGDNFLGQMAYDAVLLLAEAVKRTIENSGDPLEGVDLIKSIQGTNISGSTGQVSIDFNGDRTGAYTIFNFQTDQGSNSTPTPTSTPSVPITSTAVGVWDGSQSTRVSIQELIHWANGETSATFIPSDQLLRKFSNSCPCINPWANGTGVDISNVTCPVVGISTKGIQTCFDISYGASDCLAYDENLLPECKGTNPAPYCNKEWCFVDPNNCEREAQPSVVSFPTRSSELFASYATCGNLDDYQDSRRINDLLEIRKLRVSFPDSSGSGYTIINNNNNVDGSFPRLMNSIFDKYEIETEVVEISEASSALYPLSSFTACVHEIALNNTDVCIANTWSSEERRLLAGFLGTIYDDNIKLISFRSNGNVLETLTDLVTQGLSPFTVFAFEVWLLIFIAMLYAGAVIYFVEVKIDKETASKKEFVFYAVQSFTGGMDVRYKPTKAPGMCVTTISSFFVLICVTLFTAQITSNTILADSRINTQYSSLEHALELDAKICMLATVRDKFLLLNPNRKGTIVPSRNSLSALEAMDSGICNAALLTEDEFENSRRARDNYDPNCDKLPVGGIVFTLGNSVPVRAEFQEILSWAVEIELLNYVEIESAVKAEFLSTPVCPAAGEIFEEGQLSFQDMSGTFFIYFFTMTIILVVAFIANKFSKRDSSISSVVEKEEDKQLENKEEGDAATVPMPSL